jgi:hypothetical protein
MEYIKMSREDYLMWEKFRETPKNSLEPQEFELICRLHAEYFKHKYYKPCTCRPKEIKKWIGELNELFLNQ